MAKCLGAAILLFGLIVALPALSAPLCVDGHPAKRRPDVTYGGLPSGRAWSATTGCLYALAGPIH
jgi:hypothetical protein